LHWDSGRTEMSEYLLGIDNGATVSKVVIFDINGQALQIASHKSAADYPHPGWTERSMERAWQGTAGAIRDALGAAGINPRDILAVGACGHGNGLYLLDRHGAPLRPGILSMDTRATQVVEDWRARGVLEAVWPLVLQTPYTGQPPALLRWLKQHEPAVYSRIGTVLLIKDFVKYQLTGTPGSDPSDLSATGLLDLTRQAYSHELLDAYGIAEVAGALPPIAGSSTPIGRVSAAAAQATGLLAGTPVVGGMFDATAGPLGAGVVTPGQLCITAGTWSVNALACAAPLASQRQIFNALYLPGTWLAIDASPTSSANLEWFVAEFCAEERAEAQARGISAYEVCGERIAKHQPAGTSIVFHPFLYGANTAPAARAGFYGLAGWHTRADLLRALYEGVVYGHRSQIEPLLRLGTGTQSGRLIGGGARSPVWAQMFADVLGLTIEVPRGDEIGARGAACMPAMPTPWRARSQSSGCTRPTLRRRRAMGQAMPSSCGWRRQCGSPGSACSGWSISKECLPELERIAPRPRRAGRRRCRGALPPPCRSPRPSGRPRAAPARAQVPRRSRPAARRRRQPDSAPRRVAAARALPHQM
jgi:L-xylulokinase